MFLHLYIDCWACKLNCRIQDYAEQPVWSHFMFFNFMFKKKKKTGPHLLTLFRSMLQKRFVDYVLRFDAE